VISPAVSPQPVAAAVATTQYPQLNFNYGDNRATIYVDPTNFTADQLAAIQQGISNVQSMLAGIFTFTMTYNRSQADIIYVGHDFSDTVSSAGSRGGDTNVNYNKVSNHISNTRMELKFVWMTAIVLSSRRLTLPRHGCRRRLTRIISITSITIRMPPTSGTI
jgi:hypothetical protein